MGGREGEGGEGREGRDDCYAYSNIIQWHHSIEITSRHVLRNNVSQCLQMAPQYLNNNHVTNYVIT